MTDELYNRGEQIRREVLGEAYVNNSVASTDAFSEPMRTFAVRNLWGDVWARPGLDRRARSITNLALLAAANRPNELKIHIRAALNNGLQREEIGEIFLQVALYAGVPTGSDATRVAKLTFAEIDAEAKPA
ncbi:carboxymuconolactone decarboxylase family protein [Acidovorax sp. CCYZU-2555]|uniref:carboxymuconolactone decarboxylase family protein n=1 Tax=Acidovorax sp. CCYZU-2555 TaxID=2835042 RepID=UPI001BD164E6|nr:carboxymuconolactone decarboxylase family protein [Acidovorax sp. CCYZU-2555]MBS7780959.1 carboxymuconolactone decarboxylase family protein [Acidovorax sp. CCYZU-2555]